MNKIDKWLEQSPNIDLSVATLSWILNALLIGSFLILLINGVFNYEGPTVVAEHIIKTTVNYSDK